MNLMPSAIIQVFGRYDFAQANKIIMPLVIGIRSCAFLIVPHDAGCGRRRCKRRFPECVYHLYGTFSDRDGSVLRIEE